ncbi:MAG: leucyl/phenylalanyl-tRNA--protein transferase [Thiohalorhabdus sp.]|uniref:leucyl/phenylalanyl-tRNA--protein transferase n=1 Tax=Thiohalorhabdus sp. TaxID=3094134 RepID=UPI00397FBA10
MYLLDPNAPFPTFPDPRHASSPEGIVAIGGDLGVDRLIQAYRQGIFPWYNEYEPILWWSPDPRLVLYPERLHVSRSLRKALRRGDLTFTFDRDFSGVVRGCAEPRGTTPESAGTWLNGEMIAAYERLHAHGLAHSTEAWDREGRLVAGLYGVALGRAFFGESMFTRVTDASKMAFVHTVEALREAGYRLVDCQVYSDHLAQFGAREIARNRFLAELDRCLAGPEPAGPWPHPGEPVRATPGGP